MNSDDLIIIFTRNPVDRVHLKLLEHTYSIANKVFADKAVFFEDSVQEYGNSHYKFPAFPKFLQRGKDRGERMERAIGQAFGQNYKRVIIIGSDCYNLNTEIVEEAFEKLHNSNVVIGPSVSGAYYLLGLDRHYPHLFHNKIWDHENVFLDTLLDIQKLKLSYQILPTLSLLKGEKDLSELSDIK